MNRVSQSLVLNVQHSIIDCCWWQNRFHSPYSPNTLNELSLIPHLVKQWPNMNKEFRSYLSFPDRMEWPKKTYFDTVPLKIKTRAGCQKRNPKLNYHFSCVHMCTTVRIRWGKGVGCWGGSGTVNVWQWRQFPLWTQDPGKGVYKNHPPLNKGLSHEMGGVGLSWPMIKLIGLLLLSFALGKGSVVIVIYFYKFGAIFAKSASQWEASASGQIYF